MITVEKSMPSLIYTTQEIPKSCPITIETGLLKSGSWISTIAPLAHRFVIVAAKNVETPWGENLRKQLEDNKLQTSLFTIPAGEKYKSRKSKELIENQMFDSKCGRDTLLIALGGGVTTDLGGFIASTYNRGIPLILIPTSLLGMVDASIGGKNGIDVPQGKNLLGTFYQPKAIYIDPEVLKTLPDRELRNGLVEMIKHGLIADAAYFEYLRSHAKQMLSRDGETLETAIHGSCVIKKTIVEEDPQEKGKRRLLNCGHTIAHALEHLLQYKIPHGEAVAIGIVIEGYLSHLMGHLSKTDLDAIFDIFNVYGIPLRKLDQIDPLSLVEAMLLDKKSTRGTPRYVLLSAIGKPLAFDGHYCTPVNQSHLLEAITWYADAVRHY
jgi:3-dehydroquinate synthase